MDCSRGCRCGWVLLSRRAAGSGSKLGAQSGSSKSFECGRTELCQQQHVTPWDPFYLSCCFEKRGLPMS